MSLLKSANMLLFSLFYFFFWTALSSGLAESSSSMGSLKSLSLADTLTKEPLVGLLTPGKGTLLAAYVWYKFVGAAGSASPRLLNLYSAGSTSLLASQGSAASAQVKLFLSTFAMFGLSAAALIYSKLALEMVPMAKLFFAWSSLFFFIYLLLSGFVFFLKSYAFGSFTTLMSSFWKSSFSIFWLLESYTLGCFMYLTLNSSSEVLYFFDYQAIFKTHLFSFSFFFFKLTAATLLILMTFFLVGNLSLLKDSSMALLGTLVSALLLYIFWVEFLQFFHFVSFCEFYSWAFSADSMEWSLESETSKSSTVNNYVMLCVGAKFFHLVLMVLMWVFSFNSLLESPDSSEYLISANLQNFMMMYALNWLFMFPWFKFMAKKYMLVPYFWFFTSDSSLVLSHFFNGAHSLLLSVV